MCSALCSSISRRRFQVLSLLLCFEIDCGMPASRIDNVTGQKKQSTNRVHDVVPSSRKIEFISFRGKSVKT